MNRQRIPRLRRGYRLQFETAQNSHVLLYPEGMVKLNGSAAAIALHLDGLRSVAAIIAELDRQYPGAADLARDVDDFMVSAHAHGWIEFA
ncbi:pyrroloquinoline quinone biosynthesis protein PqqD [Pseudomonas sp. 1239]|uniref:pyrroloquinoline quinone biosynthesis peptide chaperone PqqD n=1 Tax=Pseudomonas TaxID=286 RepID=UPI0005C227B9|nr:MULTISPECIES: pyrroloquinoline quinone biosynthesis peptide chaperone PqqD [Pseudomonas]KIU52289.1 pyrroloquinoline quinone biosynthesis protein PqqD [Pseudomonas putida]OUM35507.1 pyrroloquinoline quinone biosynthesis protein PqqD [Pseudomonas sp. 1239]WKL66507.1 pyrroloquinoline quinone biosynthesis peptide chaperone PqqD [Pseudomonas qingdaonensis]